jgi:hypothetical protein
VACGCCSTQQLQGETDLTCVIMLSYLLLNVNPRCLCKPALPLYFHLTVCVLAGDAAICL